MKYLTSLMLALVLCVPVHAEESALSSQCKLLAQDARILSARIPEQERTVDTLKRKHRSAKAIAITSTSSAAVLSVLLGYGAGAMAGIALTQVAEAAVFSGLVSTKVGGTTALLGMLGLIAGGALGSPVAVATLPKRWADAHAPSLSQSNIEFEAMLSREIETFRLRARQAEDQLGRRAREIQLEADANDNFFHFGWDDAAFSALSSKASKRAWTCCARKSSSPMRL